MASEHPDYTIDVLCCTDHICVAILSMLAAALKTGSGLYINTFINDLILILSSKIFSIAEGKTLVVFPEL
jgi:hypothetical protein